MTITIVLNDQKDSKGAFKNRQIINCGNAAFRNKNGHYQTHQEISNGCRDIAHDIDPHFHQVTYSKDEE